MARDFDGSANKLVAASLISDSLTAYTVSAWVKPDNTTGNKGVVVQRSTANSTAIFMQFDVNGADLRMIARDNAGTALLLATKTGVITTSWQHVAGTRDGSSVGAYHNAGTPATGSGTMGAVTSSELHIGNIKTFASEANYFDGAIAEVGVWSVALDAGELTALAAGCSPLMVRPQSLVFYAPLHGRGGASANEEEWIAGNTLTQTGNPGAVDHPRVIYPRRRSWVPKAAASGLPTLSAPTAVPGSILTTGWRPRFTATY